MQQLYLGTIKRWRENQKEKEKEKGWGWGGGGNRLVWISGRKISETIRSEEPVCDSTSFWSMKAEYLWNMSYFMTELYTVLHIMWMGWGGGGGGGGGFFLVRELTFLVLFCLLVLFANWWLAWLGFLNHHYVFLRHEHSVAGHGLSKHEWAVPYRNMRNVWPRVVRHKTEPTRGMLVTKWSPWKQ